MPRFDQLCPACDWQDEIVVRPHEHPPCPRCGGETVRHYPIGGTRHVISDEIIGGTWIENMGHQPVYVESRSQYRRELEKRGLEQCVRHVGVKGSDKNPHTTRWY